MKANDPELNKAMSEVAPVIDRATLTIQQVSEDIMMVEGMLTRSGFREPVSLKPGNDQIHAVRWGPAPTNDPQGAKFRLLVDLSQGHTRPMIELPVRERLVAARMLPTLLRKIAVDFQR